MHVINHNDLSCVEFYIFLVYKTTINQRMDDLFEKYDGNGFLFYVHKYLFSGGEAIRKRFIFIIRSIV